MKTISAMIRTQIRVRGAENATDGRTVTRNMEKNQIIELRIEDMLDDGRAFGRCDGCAVFVSGGISDKSEDDKNFASGVSGAIPGDLVRAKVTKAKKNSAEAVLTEIIETSPDRIAAECPYFGKCGGCTLQEMSYDAQKRLKTEQVRAKLQRLGGVEDPKVNEIIGADTLKYYRNKATFAVSPHGEVGFVRGKSHFVIDIDDCMLQNDPAMVCADALRTFLRRTGLKCITQMVVRTAFGTGEVMVVLETDGHSEKSGKRNGKTGKGNSNESADIPQMELLAEMLDDAIFSLSPAAENEPGTAMDQDEYAEENTADQLEPELLYTLETIAVIHKGKCRIAAGKPTITEEIIRDNGSSILYEISPQSFYQVNPEQMVRLYDKAAEYAGIGSVQIENKGRCHDSTDLTESDNTGKENVIPRGTNGDTITVLDLYCGAGTIGIWLLDDLRSRDEEAFKKTRVIGIESVRPAIIDANRNSVINNLINTRYFCGKAEEELPGMMGLTKLYKWNEVNERVEREPEIRIEKVDVAVLDPPRAGCDEVLLEAVVRAEPERIVYVSCDPGTLARDIKYLTANGYEFIECTPVDQFIWSGHIEVVAKIQKKKS